MVGLVQGSGFRDSGLGVWGLGVWGLEVQGSRLRDCDVGIGLGGAVLMVPQQGFLMRLVKILLMI